MRYCKAPTDHLEIPKGLQYAPFVEVLRANWNAWHDALAFIAMFLPPKVHFHSMSPSAVQCSAVQFGAAQYLIPVKSVGLLCWRLGIVSPPERFPGR